MQTIERFMRVMTHVNLGAAGGMVLWLAWSGYEVVTGQRALPRPQLPQAPVRAGIAPHPVSLPCCFLPTPAQPQHRPEAAPEGLHHDAALPSRLVGLPARG